MIKRMSFGLSRELWLVVLGMFLNYLGYGAVLPFEIIYLHNGRGFPLGVAGLVVGLVTGVAVLISPLAGPLIDRFGARATATGAGVAFVQLRASAVAFKGLTRDAHVLPDVATLAASKKLATEYAGATSTRSRCWLPWRRRIYVIASRRSRGWPVMLASGSAAPSAGSWRPTV